MKRILSRRIRNPRSLTLLALALAVWYVVTVGLVPVVSRHTGSGGRLRWLPSIPCALTVLRAYQWPAEQLSRVRLFRPLFEFSAAFWWGLLDPPDTTA